MAFGKQITGLLTFLSVLFNPLLQIGGIQTPQYLSQSIVQQADGTGSVKIYIPLIMRADPGYYVATTGSDSNPGTFNAPWRTIQYAVSTAPDGQTVYVRGGDYTGFTVQRNNLVISGYPGETPSIFSDGSSKYTVRVINSSGITISGLSFHDNQTIKGAGVYVEASSGVLVKNSQFYDNFGFGIVTKDVANVTIDGNNLYRNANAIEIRYGSNGVVISNNQVHDNFRNVDSGRGAMGINFYRTTGPVTAVNNLIWDNHSLPPDPPGGSAIELFEGGNISMIGNVMWGNRTVFETGSESGVPCDNIRFLHNIAYRGDYQQGLILRCASNTLVANNVFDALDKFVFYINQFKGTYGGSVENLKIVNNIAINGRVYSIDTPLPKSVVIDHNLVYNPAPGSSSLEGDSLAYVAGFGKTLSLADFQGWTGYDLNSLSALPIFVDPANHNYRLLPQSPAIDLGVEIGEPFIGKAPDAGAYEYQSTP